MAADDGECRDAQLHVMSEELWWPRIQSPLYVGSEARDERMQTVKMIAIEPIHAVDDEYQNLGNTIN